MLANKVFFISSFEASVESILKYSYTYRNGIFRRQYTENVVG